MKISKHNYGNLKCFHKLKNMLFDYLSIETESKIFTESEIGTGVFDRVIDTNKLYSADLSTESHCYIECSEFLVGQ